MGFLELDKVHTLELFLTDKGKELMLRENSKGLFDLVSQFSLDDRDYDYRRTSSVWIDGVSPVPSGYPLYPDFGTTQGLINDDFTSLGLPYPYPTNNNCRPENGSLSGNCWFDMPDVRGHRGQKLISCILTTATTKTILSCTNIYCFYDVTSTDISDAIAAKNGLTSWFAGVTANTINYTGKIFHIPVYGEAWLNTSYYPWNGKLDSWDWAPVAPTPTSAYKRFTFCGNSGLSYNNDCTSQGITSPEIQLALVPPPQNPQAPSHVIAFKYPEPVTGLFLQADSTGVGTGNWAGFAVLPPNVTSVNSGSRVEFWTTGCTLNTLGPSGEPTSVQSGFLSNGEFPFTATTLPSGNINIVFPADTLSASTYLSGYTVTEVLCPISPLEFDTNNAQSFGQGNESITDECGIITDNCQYNCCPPLEYEGPGLFGCQDCSPFDNIYHTSYKSWAVLQPNGSPWVEIAAGITGGTIDVYTIDRAIPCEKYRGMDRNVLIVNIFDEAEAQPRASNGGFSPLGRKTWYDLTNTTPLITQTTDLGELNEFNGAQFCNSTDCKDWRDKQNLGYHGGNRGGPCGNGVSVTCGGESNSARAHYPPYGIPDDWNQWACCNDNTMGFSNKYYNNVMKNPQPTPLWLYNQDLFHKTHSFYNTFRGFVYPVVSTQNAAKVAFPLHLYGAMYGNVISEAEFNAKGDNPTVLSCGGTLSAITNTNPYSAITAVNYDPGTIFYEPASTTEPFDPSQLGPSLGWNTWYDLTYGMSGQINAGAAQIGNNIIRGLRSWGWDFNPTAGCQLPYPDTSTPLIVCGEAGTTGSSIGDIFSGGTFARDLDKFLTGNTSLSTVVVTGCTECQCLPSVFLDIKGPILITPNPTPIPPILPLPTGEVLCGPAPLSTSILIGGGPRIKTDGTSTQRLKKQSTYEVPGETSLFTSGRKSPNVNLMSLEPARDAHSFSALYTNKYSVGYDVIFHNYLNNNDDIEFDLELYSMGQYGDNKITEADGASFYWVVESGYKKSGPITITKLCKPLTKIKVNSNKPKYVGGSTSYARAHSNLGDEFKITNNGMDTYILCIGLAMSIHNLMFFETHRYKIDGTPKYGYQYTRLA